MGVFPSVEDLKRYVDDRIKRFEGELEPGKFDVKNEVVRARIVELNNFKIIVDGLICGQGKGTKR